MDGSGPPNGDPIRTGREGIGFLVSIAARALTARFDEALRPYGLDHIRLIIIRNVVRDYPQQPEGVAVSLLAEKLVLPAPVLADRGRALAYTGWITVRGSGEDMRLVPTRKAQSMMPVLVDATRWTYEQALNGFSREEILTLSDGLKGLIRNFGIDAPAQD